MPIQITKTISMMHIEMLSKKKGNMAFYAHRKSACRRELFVN